MSVDRLEDLAGESIRLEQATKLEQRRRVWRVLAGEVNADEATDRLAVVERILDAFVGESEALLRDIHPQHPVQTNRWPAATFALRVERRNLRLQRRLPRRDRLDLPRSDRVASASSWPRTQVRKNSSASIEASSKPTSRDYLGNISIQR